MIIKNVPVIPGSITYNSIAVSYPSLLALVILLMLNSCNSSRITTSWSTKRTLDPSVDRLIVIALVPANEREMAQQFEKHLANDLSEMGYQALSAFNLYGPLAFCPGNDTIIYDKLREKGITALLTVALLDKRTVEKFVPGHYIHPVNFMDYVGPKYTLLYEPAHMEVETDYYWETRVYYIRSEDLIYFSESTSFNPGSIRSMAHEYGQKITRNLVKRKILLPAMSDLEN